jgi:molybdenum cofactor guanylyltransferase
MISSLILAGGESRRMGKDKALLEIDGVPLLKKIHGIAAAGTDQVYVIASPRPGFPVDWQYLPEANPGQGPLIAFAAGLERVDGDWVLLLACDLPYLKIAAVQRWCQELGNVPEGAIAYLAPHPKGWEALCGFYRPRCLPSLKNWIAQGERSFQPWLAQEIVAPMIETDQRFFVNWNRPEDLPEIPDLGALQKADNPS